MSMNDAINIVKLYLFGTLQPATDDYNKHVTREGASLSPVYTFNAGEYMTTGAGRYAEPSLAPIVAGFLRRVPFWSDLVSRILMLKWLKFLVWIRRRPGTYLYLSTALMSFHKTMLSERSYLGPQHFTWMWQVSGFVLRMASAPLKGFELFRRQTTGILRLAANLLNMSTRVWSWRRTRMRWVGK